MMEYAKPAVFVLLPSVGSLPSAYFMKRQIAGWYDKLKKPWFTPPNWVFGPVWVSLYYGMGYASYLVYRQVGGPTNPDARLPLGLYGSQLALNWIWSPVFFYKHKMGLGAVIIWADWLLVAGCVYTFYRVDKTAGYLMAPLLGWLTLAGAINTWIWRQNAPPPRVKKGKSL